MKKTLLLLLFSFNVHALDIGSDFLGGKTSVNVVDGPPIYKVNIEMEKMVNPSTTDPMIRVAAFATCNENQLVPKFMDMGHEKQTGKFLYWREFKCIGGDTVDWTRASKMMCTESAGTSGWIIYDYCKILQSKHGDAFAPCKGRCETVQDTMIFRQ